MHHAEKTDPRAVFCWMRCNAHTCRTEVSELCSRTPPRLEVHCIVLAVPARTQQAVQHSRFGAHGVLLPTPVPTRAMIIEELQPNVAGEAVGRVGGPPLHEHPESCVQRLHGARLVGVARSLHLRLVAAEERGNEDVEEYVERDDQKAAEVREDPTVASVCHHHNVREIGRREQDEQAQQGRREIVEVLVALGSSPEEQEPEPCPHDDNHALQRQKVEDALVRHGRQGVSEETLQGLGLAEKDEGPKQRSPVHFLGRQAISVDEQDGVVEYREEGGGDGEAVPCAALLHRPPLEKVVRQKSRQRQGLQR
mmetsp:Transcript_18834/g.51810  ORF Transcript_18834/g.51810 Transcript_18834/m.51810 type:complete len:309 (+) Transcript_18834:172-1098(+)